MIYLVPRSKGIEHRDGIEHLAAMCIQRHHPCGHGEDERYPLPWHEILQFVASFEILIRTKLPVYFVFMVGLATLTLTGCIELKTATEGFSSSTMESFLLFSCIIDLTLLSLHHKYCKS